MLVFLQILTISCWALVVHGQRPVPTETFPHYAVMDNEELVHLYWDFDETHITFEVHGFTVGWVAIGISPNGNMANADITAGWVKNGVATITDRQGGSSNGYPSKDDVQNVELLEGFEVDGWTVLKFRRPLIACDVQDLDITDETLRIIYARGTDDPSGDDLQSKDKHPSSNRGTKSMILLAPATSGDNWFPEGERHLTFDMLNDNVVVPEKHTYYHCRLFELPEIIGKHHVVKVEPIIQPGNELYVHHILVYQCLQTTNMTLEIVDHECYQPNMPADFDSCEFLMISWAVGGGPVFYPKHAGFPLGTTDSPKYVMIETHYDNPDSVTGIFDSSGMRITHTPDVRNFDAGILSVGHIVLGTTFILPDGAETLGQKSECSSNCFEKSLEADGQDSINVFAVMLHAHTIARGIKLKHIRNGTELPPISTESNYDFNFQETRTLKEERVVQKGDSMQIVCNYQSTERTDITMGGQATTDEMCFAYLIYYPKLSLSYCQSAPYLNSLMHYFGITEFEKTSNEKLVNLHDILVLAPPEHAGKTAYEVINAINWNSESATKFIDAANTMMHYQRCATVTGRPQGVTGVITPLTIDEPYVPPPSGCP